MSRYVKTAHDQTVWLVANDGQRRLIDWQEYVDKGKPPVMLISEAELAVIPIRGESDEEE